MPNNIIIKDTNSQNVTLETTETLGVHTPHHISKLYDANGIPLGTTTNPIKIDGGITDVAGNPLGSQLNPLYSVPSAGMIGTPSKDSYYKERISIAKTVFSSNLPYDLRLDVWENIGTGTVTHIPVSSSALLTVLTGQSIKRSSKYFIRTKPGDAISCKFNVQLSTSLGVTKRVGFFDVSNGAYFENDGTGLAVVDRKNTSGQTINNKISQANWNLDKLDGTTQSGILLDVSKVQNTVIDIDYSGNVKWGFEINGITRYVHEINHGNSSVFGYWQNLVLPCSLEIIGLSGTGTISHFSTTVLIESSQENQNHGITGSKSTGVTPKLINGIDAPVIGIRVAPDWPHGSGQTFRGEIRIDDFSIFSTQSQIHWHLKSNSVITGGIWIKHPDSPIEYNISMVSFSGGKTIAEDYTDKRSTSIAPEIKTNLKLGLNNAGIIQDSILLTAVDLNGLTDVYGKIQWTADY